MKLREVVAVVTYETGHEDFLIDVVRGSDAYDVWLYRESWGPKLYVTTMPSTAMEFEEFCASLEKGMDLAEDYATYYEMLERLE